MHEPFNRLKRLMDEYAAFCMNDENKHLLDGIINLEKDLNEIFKCVSNSYYFKLFQTINSQIFSGFELEFYKNHWIETCYKFNYGHSIDKSKKMTIGKFLKNYLGYCFLW